ncbi:HAAS signaling domain-containing protein [Jeotgalibacillus aurantiacus]|uniref:HAAS signaling domain-containing protein n=1 Tax=Jeotgalibacillus aurantiacus TaxID=2763266 RepID=UPI001D0AE77B|nr:hypothetical protein [Jeotgalibacillus aurantiacus]
MNLIDAYVYEVTRRLPEKNRHDIGLELNSIISDMLPEHPTEQEVKDTLARMGDPMILAARYADRPMHLIGPGLFPSYVSVLKITMPIALSVITISIIIGEITAFSGNTNVINTLIDAILSIGAGIFSVAVQVLFWITAVFFMIERSGAVKDSTPLSKWTPDELKKTALPKRTISRTSLIGNLIWTAVWATAYFNASSLIGIYINGDMTVPIFNEEILRLYLPVVIIFIAAEIAMTCYKWAVKVWTNRLAVINAVYNLIWTITAIVFLTNPNILHPDLASFLTDLFGGSAIETTNSINWAIWTTIVIILISSIIDSYEGFSKCRKSIKPPGTKKSAAV